MQDNYQFLINKLDSFIRKYYKNQIIRGTISTVSILLLLFIVITALEYAAHFGIVVRTVIFYSFLILALLVFLRFVLFPVFQLLKIGKIISHEQAADIIGKHFSDVNDVLINTLQLKKLAENSKENKELINASINQKVVKLRPIPFNSAIDFKKNRKYIKFVAIPVLLIIITLFTSPSVITDPFHRIVKHDQFFEIKAPFQIKIMNSKLEAIQQEDFVLEIKLTGNEIPSELYIKTEEATFKCNKEKTVLFNYTFNNIQQSTKFQLIAGKFRSPVYELKVIPRPIILNFDIALNYPKYTRKGDEVLSNTGDLLIPDGTKVNWRFYTRDTKKIQLNFEGKPVILNSSSSNKFSFSSPFYKSTTYSIQVANEYMKNNDSLMYSVNVIPDAYPSINVNEFKDSIYNNRLFFNGYIKDDYGFTRLTFKYKILNKEGEPLGFRNLLKTDTIPINSNQNQQQYYYFLDVTKLDILPGDELEYYFEVWDNDGIHGAKSSKTQKMVFKVPTLNEIEKSTENSNKEIKEDIQQTIKDVKALQHQIDELNKKLLEKKSLSWQDKKQIEDLLDKQKEIQKNVDNINKKNQTNNIQEQIFKPVENSIVEKQNELQRLFNEVMNDKMKKMFEDMQKLLDEADKTKVNEMLEKIKSNNKDLEKQLDRNLELFKRIEFDKKLTETIEKINKLADEQTKLSEETKKNTNENTLQKQNDLNNDFENIKKNIDELEKKNEELEKKNDLKNTDEKQNSIEQEMKKSLENIKNKKGSKASQSQKNASKQMEELSQSLGDMQQEMDSEESGEDIAALREILENLLRISFEQENLIKITNNISSNNPKYLKIIQQQKDLKDDFTVVNDSLFSLSKRQMMIQSFVLKETIRINSSFNQSLESLELRNINIAKSKQQYIMTSVNNLSLLLSEILKQMENQQNMQMPGKGKSSCSKPGSGSPSMKTMRQLQEQLNKQMEQLKNGKGKGDGKSQQSMSEQLARMAAEQQAIRQQYQKYGEELNKQGAGADGNLKKIVNDMEQTETDIVNKAITNETLKRQQQILTRLLESEKAEQQREKEQKRESTEAKNTLNNNNSKLLDYKKEQITQNEFLKYNQLKLKTFYKQKANSYFIHF